MSARRSIALLLLPAVLRRSPAESREWVQAMLREMDFIESDWAALFWAIGSASAIFRHSGWGLKAWLRKKFNHEEERTVNEFGKKAVGLISGIALAAVLALCAFGIYVLLIWFFPSLHVGRLPLAAWLTVIVLPEAAFILGIVMLWRKRRPMAVGILLSATVLATHFVLHIVSQWNG